MYVCALRSTGEPLSTSDVFGALARLRAGDGILHSLTQGPFVAAWWSRPGELRPQLASWRGLMGAGDVRLDNAAEVARMAGITATATSHLQLVLAALDAAGEACIPRLLGDFAFVVWDERAHKLLAVRDAFGVKPLYCRTVDDVQLFASAVAPLQRDDEYDTDYIAEFLGGLTVYSGRTIWRGIGAVGAGTVLRQRGTVRTVERYWRAEEYTPALSAGAADPAEFRALLKQGVRARLDDDAETWAQLSGGLDSSSVVLLARELGARIGGTITVVDSLGSGDERRYSDLVAGHCQLHNEQVCDYRAWLEDGEGPPRTDEPAPLYPFHAQDRRICAAVRRAGGRVLLSGFGSDHYLYGTLDYITDLAAAGRIRTAARELTAWAVATRQSFWGLARRFVLEPLFSRESTPAAGPAWLAPALRAARAPTCGTPPHSRFTSAIARGLAAVPAWLERWPYGDDVELRYPFLYRPLVEWSLGLAPQQRIRPTGRKWILREAMRGVLPEEVRTRTSKGSIDGRILWSLRHEKRRLDAALRDPVLAQLGCIEPAPLRDAVDRAVAGVPVNNVQLLLTLSLETWLAVQSGTWPVPATRAATAA